MKKILPVLVLLALLLPGTVYAQDTTPTEKDFWDSLQQTIEIALQVFIPILLTAIGKAVGNALRTWRTRDEFRQFEKFVVWSVNAAEKLGYTDQLEEWGMTKLEYAISRTEQLLQVAGINLDVDEPVEIIRAAIEAYLKEIDDSRSGASQQQ